MLRYAAVSFVLLLIVDRHLSYVATYFFHKNDVTTKNTLARSIIIPKLIFKTSEESLPDVHPRFWQIFNATLENNPEYTIVYCSKDDRQHFMRTYYPQFVEGYESILPSAFKADIWRFLVIYTFGGHYSDIAMQYLIKIRDIFDSDGNDGFVTSLDLGKGCILPGFFAAFAGHPLMGAVVDHVMDNVNRRIYGCTTYDITGPRAFGRAFQYFFKMNETSNIEAGSYTRHGLRLKILTFAKDVVRLNGTDCVRNKFDGYYQIMYSSKKKLPYGLVWKMRRVYSEDVNTGALANLLTKRGPAFYYDKLVKCDANGTIWYVSNGTRREFKTYDTFKEMGFDVCMLETRSPESSFILPLGVPFGPDAAANLRSIAEEGSNIKRVSWSLAGQHSLQLSKFEHQHRGKVVEYRTFASYFSKTATEGKILKKKDTKATTSVVNHIDSKLSFDDHVEMELQSILSLTNGSFWRDVARKPGWINPAIVIWGNCSLVCRRDSWLLGDLVFSWAHLDVSPGADKEKDRIYALMMNYARSPIREDGRMLVLQSGDLAVLHITKRKDADRNQQLTLSMLRLNKSAYVLPCDSGRNTAIMEFSNQRLYYCQDEEGKSTLPLQQLQSHNSNNNISNPCSVVEKNWVPFEREGELLFIQKINPIHVLRLPTTAETAAAAAAAAAAVTAAAGTAATTAAENSSSSSSKTTKTTATTTTTTTATDNALIQMVTFFRAFNRTQLPWKHNRYGKLRGGTPAIKVPRDGQPGGLYLMVFHSSELLPMWGELLQNRGQQMRFYWMGALAFCPNPPFNIYSTSAVPIANQSFYKGSWRYKKLPYVVFPTSITLDSDNKHVWVMFGHQDKDGYHVQWELAGLFDSMVHVQDC